MYTMNSTFQSKIRKKIRYEFRLVPDDDEPDVDLEDHYSKQLEFRDEIMRSKYGKVNCIIDVDENTSKSLFRNLPIDESNIVIDAKQKIKNVTDEKIAVFIEHSETDAIFIKLFDKPSEDSWDESSFKNFLYSEGVTASSIEDVIGTRLPIEYYNENNNKGMKNKNLTYVLKDRTIAYLGLTILFCSSIYIYSPNLLLNLSLTVPIFIYSIWFIISKYYTDKVGGD